VRLQLSNQGGWFVLLVVLAMLGVTIAIVGVGSNFSAAKINRREATISSLAKAKEALLNYAISRDDVGGGSRPGEFPCPTLVAPGTPSYGDPAGGCVTFRIGRLPWKALGIPELFDESGEPLWYALSIKFNKSVTYVNSSSVGDLVVYAADGLTLQQKEVVAVVFSAGSPMGNQNRSKTDSAPCAATGGTIIVRNICADNYLDAVAGRANFSNTGPFISGPATSSFNDSLVYVTTTEFMPRIESRIAAALIRTINSYYAMTGYYPYAAYYSDATAVSENSQANCAYATFSGRFPQNISVSGLVPVAAAPCVGLKEWSDVPSTYQLPTWFFINHWHLSTYYAVGKAYVKDGLKSCLVLGDCLTVDGDTSVQAVFILPGIPTSTPPQIRPTEAPRTNISAALNIKNYFEDLQNQQGWDLPNDFRYKLDTSKLPSSDHLIIIKN
jgi:type II secretory pathway pseudopilin PulG